MESKRDSSVGTWILIFAVVLWFLCYSLYAYLAIGDRGSPDWNLGTIQDVPSSSPYATYEKLPDSQHIRGRGGD